MEKNTLMIPFNNTDVKHLVNVLTGYTNMVKADLKFIDQLRALITLATDNKEIEVLTLVMKIYEECHVEQGN